MASKGKAPAFEVYSSNRSGEFRWRLRASNGKIVATSSEGYKRKVDLINALRVVKASSGAGEPKDVQISKLGPRKGDAKAKAGKVRKAPRKPGKGSPKARKPAPRPKAPAMDVPAGVL
jgi:hypothetical protein